MGNPYTLTLLPPLHERKYSQPPAFVQKNQGSIGETLFRVIVEKPTGVEKRAIVAFPNKFVPLCLITVTESDQAQ
jgi:hypothetical protein